MKKIVTLLAILILLLSLSFQAMAFSFDLDGNYYLGLDNMKINTEAGGFAVSARAGIMGNIWVDGSFLSTKMENLMAGGALYQVVDDHDLSVLIGGGYLGVNKKGTNTSDLTGQGVYWKMILKYLAASNLIIGGEVAYAPFYHSGAEKNNFLLGKATLGYELYRNLGLQVSVQKYGAGKESSTKGMLIGLGVAVRH